MPVALAVEALVYSALWSVSFWSKPSAFDVHSVYDAFVCFFGMFHGYDDRLRGCIWVSGSFRQWLDFSDLMPWFASSIRTMISSDLSLSKSIACLDTPCNTILDHCSITSVPSNMFFHSILYSSSASLSDVHRILIP